MRKERNSKLEPFAEQLEEWFEQDKLTLRQARQRLRKRGCQVSCSRLSNWWARRRQQRLQRQLLEQIATGAAQCAEVERQFGENPAPAIETLIRLHRVLVFKLSSQADASSSALLRLLPAMMKPVLEWARLEDQRKTRELAEQRYREKAAAQQAARARGAKDADGDNALSTPTLEKIERELNLL